MTNAFSTRAQLAILLVYAGMIAFIVPYHEPWTDETTPWMMMREVSFAQLSEATHNLGYTMLWHLMLTPFARAGLPFETIYVIHGIIAVAMVAVVLRFAPFSRTTKLLWTFSNLILYQYAVLARPYSLTSLMLFTVAAIYPLRFTRPMLYAAAVFMLFEGHVIVFMVPCALTAAYLWEMWRNGRMEKRQVAAFLLMVAGCLVAVYQLRPPQDPDHMFHGFANLFRGEGFVVGLSDGWLPYALLDASDNRNDLMIIITVLMPLLIPLVVINDHIKKTVPVFIFVLAMLWMAYVFMFKFPGTFWHHGLAIQVTLFSLWLASYYKGEAKHQGREWVLINLCLLYGCVLTPFLYYKDYIYPFSAGKAAAAFIRKNHLEDRILISDRLEAMTPYLPKGACNWVPYARRCINYDTWDAAFYIYRKQRKIEGIEHPALTIAKEVFGDFSGKVVMLQRPATEDERKRYGLVLVFCESGIQDDAWIYLPEGDFKKLAGKLILR